MPCCRHKARPASSHADAAHAKPCCSQTANPSSGSGSGCRYDQTHLALDPGHAAPLVALAATASVIRPEAHELPLLRGTAFLTASSPLKTPIFLRTQALLI
jgi:hypothetical protein